MRESATLDVPGQRGVQSYLTDVAAGFQRSDQGAETLETCCEKQKDSARASGVVDMQTEVPARYPHAEVESRKVLSKRSHGL